MTDRRATPGQHSAALPLVVGVTGHRDIPEADRPLLISRLRTELDALRKRFPATPVAAMSSLAEGADRLFAECALALDIPLYVPLPLAAEDYEQDFADEASIAAFRHLCGRAHAVFRPGADDIEERFAHDPALWRQLQYANAGFYIAQRSHVLFALWDGAPARGTGGTAQIVEVRTGGIIQATGDVSVDLALRRLAGLSRLADPGPRTVCWLPVRHSLEEPEPGALAWLPATLAGDAQASALAGVAQMDLYNAALAARAPDGLGEPVPGGGAALIYSRFLSADTLAVSDIQRVRLRIRIIFWLAFVVVVLHEFYGEFWPQWPALVAYLAALGVVGLFAWGLRRRHLNPLSVDYRALAEGLRIQHAWQIAGVAENVSQHYLKREAEQLGWVREALAGVALVPPRADEQELSRVRTGWVEDQCKYFEKSVQRRREPVHKAEHRARVLFWGGMAAAFTILVNHWLHFLPGDHGGHGGIVVALLSSAIVVLPAGAGLISAYVEFAGMEEDVREHRRMKALFERAAREMAGSPEVEQRRIAYELGIEALRENALWAVAHKSRQPNPPAG